MITYAQIKSIAAKNGCKVEVSPINSKTHTRMVVKDGKYTWEDYTFILGYKVGVQNLFGRKGRSEWQWFWFETLACDETLDDDSQLLFIHRYSQLTGQYNKGLMERVKVMEFIDKNVQ